MTPRALLAAVRRTALVRFIDSGGEISFDQAEREAAREIAAEQRAQPRAATLVAAAPDGPITIRNAREHLIARVMALATRMRDPLRATVARASDAPGVVAPRPSRVVKSNKPELPEAATPTIGVFAGDTTGGQQRIDDSEFHRSVIDLTTSNWRRSLANTKRGSQWIG